MENRTRYQERVDLAEVAVMRASSLAREAERFACIPHRHNDSQARATAANAWTKIAIAHAAIARAYPVDTDTPEAEDRG